MALEAGEVDMIIEVESTDLSRLQDNPDIVTVNEPGTGHNWVMVNNEKAPFDNVDFRRAIDAAVDKNAVVQVALNGQGSVSDSMLPECFPGVVTDGAPTYDPEKAKEYLAASGLSPADCAFAIDLLRRYKAPCRTGDPVLLKGKPGHRRDAGVHGPCYIPG